jgi:hypothetical protein
MKGTGWMFQKVNSGWLNEVGAFQTLSGRVAVAVPPSFCTVRMTEKVPEAVGVPVMRPVVALIERHAHQGAFAIFDADNTSYQHDLLGALLPFMENKGILTRDTMPPSLVLIPFQS